MTTSTMATLMRLPTTLESTSVKASWAPVTSLLRRLTRAPVWVRVKKARGMRCTWSNTLRAHVVDEVLADPRAR